MKSATTASTETPLPAMKMRQALLSCAVGLASADWCSDKETGYHCRDDTGREKFCKCTQSIGNGEDGLLSPSYICYGDGEEIQCPGGCFKNSHTGTQGMCEAGGCGEAWNLDEPDRVIAIQRRYVEAGSDCLITNTFGGSRIMLERHTDNPDVVGINKAAVEVARRAFGDREGFVLGDIGPFGGLMEPYGEITRAEVDRAFAEQEQISDKDKIRA
mgnify:CR=1 FL=1